MYSIPLLKGRNKITLDVSREEFLNNPIVICQKFLGKMLGVHNQNVRDCQIILKEVLGEQDILNKEREDESSINNKAVENHLFRIRKNKVSYLVGKQIQYSSKDGNSEDDMKYFNKYIQDCGKPTNDCSVYEDVVQYGIGYRMIIPRRKKIDSKWESPIEDFKLDIKNVFTVYSSDVTKDELCSCIISNVYNLKNNRTEKKYMFYFQDEEDYCNNFSINGKGEIVDELIRENYKYNPIIEYVLNQDRIGILEPIIVLQDILNKIDSCQLDDIAQFVQAFLVFYNQDVDLTTEEGRKEWQNLMNTFRSTRAVLLNSENKDTPAKLELLAQQLDHSSINEVYNRFKVAMYDIAASQQSSGSVTSGGDTTGARLLGNGWEIALSDANVDTKYLQRAEYKWVKFFVAEARARVEQFNEVFPSDIEIKYDFNMSDNLLVKTQSIVNLYSAKMPKDLILTAIPLLSDVYGSQKKWQEYEDEQLKKEQELNSKSNSNGVNNVSVDSNSNNQKQDDISQQKKVTNAQINSMGNQ